MKNQVWFALFYQRNCYMLQAGCPLYEPHLPFNATLTHMMVSPYVRSVKQGVKIITFFARLIIEKLYYNYCNRLILLIILQLCTVYIVNYSLFTLYSIIWRNFVYFEMEKNCSMVFFPPV